MPSSLSEAGDSSSLSSKSPSALPCDLELTPTITIPANSMRNGDDDDVLTIDHNGSSPHQSLDVKHANSVLPQCSASEPIEGQDGDYNNSSKSHRETPEITTTPDSESTKNDEGEPIQDKEEDSISGERSLGSISSGSSRSSRSSGSSYSSGSSRSSSLDSSYDTSSFDSSSVSSSVFTSSISSFESNCSTPVEGRQAARRAKRQASRDDISESSNEDDLAKMISATMAAHGLALGQALAERAACVDSIKWLGQHLPETVVQFLIDEIEAEETDEVAVSKSILSPQADSPDEIQIHARESSLSKGHPEAKNDDDSYHLDAGESDLEDDKSTHGPIHYQQPIPSEGPPRAGRRHSMSCGSIIKKSSAMDVSSRSVSKGYAAQFGRRSSMPLKLRSIEDRNNSIRDIAALRYSRREERPSLLMMIHFQTQAMFRACPTWMTTPPLSVGILRQIHYRLTPRL
jgi:trimeric autotransporter adhesin